MRKRKDSPGLIRLRALDLQPRPPLVRPVIAAMVAVPQVVKPVRKRKAVPEQGALL